MRLFFMSYRFLFLVGNLSVTSCDGSTKYGSNIYVDFYKIDRPCNCIVTAFFDGFLLLFSKEELKGECRTQVIVQNTFVFGCTKSQVSSQTFDLQINQSVNARAGYLSDFTSGNFYNCLGFQQNGNQSAQTRCVRACVNTCQLRKHVICFSF